jgi:hypothetical protein
MSNQSRSTDQQGGDQLFQNMDEQERVYAPEQVPGAVGPDAEVDQGGTAASGTANADEPSYTESTAAGPVSSGGTGIGGGAATPNVGDQDPRTQPGDPNPRASYPLDHEHQGRSSDPNT